MRYEEVKALIKEKCHLTDIIVDNLVLETTLTRKVTIGLSDDNDAAIVFKELNGLVLGGRKIVVEDLRKNKVYYFKLFFLNLCTGQSNVTFHNSRKTFRVYLVLQFCMQCRAFW